MKTKLGGYGFSQAVQATVAPIVEAMDAQDVAGVERKIAALALDVVNRIQAGGLSPAEADKFFTLIDLYLTDRHRELRLSQHVRDLLFEGMILHDFGKEYGANLDTIRTLASAVLNVPPESPSS